MLRLFDECEAYFKVCTIKMAVNGLNLLKWMRLRLQVDCIDLLVNNAGINTNLGWKKCMEV